MIRQYYKYKDRLELLLYKMEAVLQTPTFMQNGGSLDVAFADDHSCVLDLCRLLDIIFCTCYIVEHVTRNAYTAKMNASQWSYVVGLIRLLVSCRETALAPPRSKPQDLLMEEIHSDQFDCKSAYLYNHMDMVTYLARSAMDPLSIFYMEPSWIRLHLDSMGRESNC